AMNSGIDRSAGEVVVFLDDDAAPAPDWLERIGSFYLREPCLGGLGGRDRVHMGDNILEAGICRVGILTWYGRIIGNHHLGTGAPREVDHLKGANMSFRRRALGKIRCDSRLAGKGAQYRNDMALSLAVGRKGWLIVYDPGILVDHFYSVRFDEDQRGVYDPLATVELAHNEMLVILSYVSGIRRFMAFLWSFMVSSTAIPGFVQVLRMAVKGQADVFSRFRNGMRGRWRGIMTYVSSR
ncbi:MAG: glycosyltransferase, partial [Candidatus Omnitrophica bacterium]|nr:glycosyltransferase [Candidatus Omnitrophota bacterium]